MKFSQGDEPNRRMFKAYIDEAAMLRRSALTESRDRILGYLFILNAGGIVAGVTYQSSQQVMKHGVTVAVRLFAFGLLAIVLRATADYFGCQFHSGAFFKNLRMFYANNLEWEKLIAEDQKESAQWPYIALGVSSGICFFLGLGIGIVTCLQH